MLNVTEVTDTDGVPAVGLLMTEDHTFLDPATSTIKPGVSLTPGAARELAYTLLLLAQQLENKMKVKRFDRNVQ